MRKKYLKPNFKFIEFTMEDIICSSGPCVGPSTIGCPPEILQSNPNGGCEIVNCDPNDGPQ